MTTVTPEVISLALHMAIVLSSVAAEFCQKAYMSGKYAAFATHATPSTLLSNPPSEGKHSSWIQKRHDDSKPSEESLDAPDFNAGCSTHSL